VIIKGINMGYPISLQDRAEACYENSKAHGFWENCNLADANVLAAKLCLIHSEVSEALESARISDIDLRFENQKPEGLISELADICIRVFDLAEALNRQKLAKHSIETAIREKMIYNESRPMKHGKAI
jgi:hypothetical protein